MTWLGTEPAPWCARHGVEWHARVHEAGHGIAAIDLGITLRSVAVHPTPTRFEGARPGESANGGTRIEPMAIRASLAAGHISNLALFMFAAAGESAEHTLLDHATPGGAAADYRQFWAWTKGQTFVAIEEYAEVLGETFSSARRRARSWARTRAPAILALALRLEPGRAIEGAELLSLVQSVACRDGQAVTGSYGGGSTATPVAPGTAGASPLPPD